MADMQHRHPSVPMMSPRIGIDDLVDDAVDVDVDAGDGGGSTALRHLQVVCDDLYCTPLDREAQEKMRDLLLRSTPGLREARLRARRIKIACDELHDDPSDIDARFTLLNLLDTPA
ncbi:hypothetical protein LIX17_25070 (plasmid) [Mycobacterium avium subsp. hominissuis]|uniref:hypothetical protein n=1 Tax=Mycobacterium avium TaxID=1764 RepID=UPI003140BBB7